MPRWPSARRRHAESPRGTSRPCRRPRRRARPAGPACGSRWWPWCSLALLGGGGYYATPSRGPDPETVKARAAAEEAEAGRLKAEEEAAKLRAENEQRLKAEEVAAARQRQEDAEAAAKKQFEEETRRKIEAEMAAQKKAEEEAKRKADEEAEARRKAVEDARKAVEFVAGAFDHFGKTLMTDRPEGPHRRDPPAGRRHRQRSRPAQGRGRGAGRPAARPALPADRPADRRHAALSLPDHAAQRQAPLADIPDSDRLDLALALVRNGLVLASCDAPRSYADAEDDARGRKQALWGRVTVPEYKRRCTK